MSNQNARLLATLINRVSEKLTKVLGALATVLDGISRAFNPAVLDDTVVSLDILHSQLFILRLIGDCTAYQWKCHRTSMTGDVHPANASHPESDPYHSISRAPSVLPRRVQSPAPTEDAASAFPNTGGSGMPRSPTSDSFGYMPPPHKLSYLTSATDYAAHSAGAGTMSIRPPFLDPPPLDDHLARFLLSVVTRFFYTTASAINTDAIGHGFGILSETTDQSVALSALQSSTTFSTFASFFSPSGQAPNSDTYFEIHKAAGRVLFFLSAANWTVVFAKIKSRIIQLSQEGAAGSSSSRSEMNQTADRETGDLTELRFLEWCCSNRHRLGMIIAELTSHSKNFSKRAQFVTAVVLRRAIWNWIETFPAEFQVLCQSQGRMEGNPDLLFDIFNNNTDSTRRKTLFWPVQTMLLTLCPDVLYAIGMVGNAGDRQRLLAMPGGSSTSLAKKAAFLETVRKSVRYSKNGESATLCCVDMVEASSFVSKAEGGPIRLVAATLEVELKEKLFDQQRPLILTSGAPPSEDGASMDYRLLAECVSALYKVNPWNTLRTVVPTMADTNAPALYKLAFVRAFWNIVAEGEALPWNPTVDASLASAFRALFSDCAIVRPTPDLKTRKSTGGNSNTSGSSAGAFRPHADKKGKRANQEEHYDKLHILANILRMWYRCPMLLVARDSGVVGIEEMRNVVSGLTVCAVSVHPMIRELSAKVLERVMAAGMVGYWDGSVSDWRMGTSSGASVDVTMRNYWRTTSQVLSAISRAIVDEISVLSDMPGPKDLLMLGCRMMELRISYLKERGKNVARLGMDVPERYTATVLMEVAILVILAGMWGEASVLGKAAARWLDLLLYEGDLLGETEMDSVSPIVENADIYREISRVVATGGAGQKIGYKRVRALLRGIRAPTTGCLAAWEEIFRVWKERRMSVLGEEEQDKGKETEWLMWTAFLCAVGGVCLRATPGATDSQSGVGGQSAGSFSTVARRKSTGSAAISELTTTTSNSSASSVDAAVPWNGVMGLQLLNARATIDRFSSDLLTLLTHDNVSIREGIKDCLASELSETLYPLVFTHMQALIGESLMENGEVKVTPRNTLFVEYVTSVMRLALERCTTEIDVDFLGIVVALLKYLDVLRDVTSLKIRVRLCMVVEILVTRREVIGVRGEMRVRRDILDALMYSHKYLSVNLAASAREDERVFKDTETACVKAMAVLLDGLPLQNGVKACFDFLTIFVMRCLLDDEAVHQHGALREHAIAALSHLVCANVETGMPLALDMMYHASDCVRGAFAGVLGDAVMKGVVKEGMRDRLQRLTRLVELIVDTEQGLEIAFALGEVASVSDADDVASVLVAVFESRGKVLELIERAVDREITRTDNAANLFRRNSMATRLLGVYASLKGSGYLRGVLGPVVEDIVRSPGVSFELDPVKLSNTPVTDYDTNLKNLKLVSQRVLDCILLPGVAPIPTGIRHVCALIWRLVHHRFPDAKVVAVGGFLFLRFFCPAIVSPETHGFVSTVSKDTRRGLVLITKVVQNLANNVLFGVKEGYMAPLNDVLRDNVRRVHGFLRDVSVMPIPDDVSEIEENAVVGEGEMWKLHLYLSRYIERIERFLSQRRASKNLPSLAAQVDAAPTGATPVNGAGTSMKNLSRRSVSQLASPRTSATAVTSSPAKKPGHSPSKSVFMISVVSDVAKFSEPDTRMEDRGVIVELSTLLAELGPANDVDSTAGTPKAVTTFSHVLFHKSKPPITVSLHIGNEVLQVSSPNPASNTKGTTVSEVYHVTELEEVMVTKENEVCVKIMDRTFPYGRYRLVFGCREAEKVLRCLEDMIKQYRNSVALKDRTDNQREPSERERRGRVMKQQDVAGALLFVSMVGMMYGDLSVRRAGYELLCTVWEEFLGDKVPNRVMAAKGVFIPSFNDGYIVDVSGRVAEGAKELTTEFLRESVVGLRRCGGGMRRLGLEILVPWLGNLEGLLESDEEGIRGLLESLVTVTVAETELLPLFLDKIWGRVSRSEQVIHLALDVVLGVAIGSASKPLEIEILATIIRTLATGTYPVLLKVLSRLRATISSTSQRCTSALVDHPTWTEIAVFLRLVLVLSFDTPEVEVCLPDLLHVVTMVVGIGSPLVRNSTHGIVVNAVHALCTEGRRRLTGERQVKLKRLVEELGEAKMCLIFGVSDGFSTGEIARDVGLSGLEGVIKCLSDVLEWGALSSDQSLQWKSRWMSLITSTAFTFHPAIQPRAFIALGTLASQEVDDDLCYQILVALRGALSLFEDNECGLIVSIVMALGHVVGGTRYGGVMFWMALALMQVGSVGVFGAAVGLMGSVLKSLDEKGMFEHESVAHLLMRSRSIGGGVLENVLQRLDSTVGIGFREETFAFAVAANLIKGLRHSSTKTATLNLLKSFIDVTRREEPAGRIGYVLPMVMGADRPVETLQLAGFEFDMDDGDRDMDDAALRSACYRLTLHHLTFHPQVSTLTILMLFTLTEIAEYDTEQSNLLEFLAEACDILPDSFAVVYGALVPRLIGVLGTSMSWSAVDGVQRILVGCQRNAYQPSPVQAFSAAGTPIRRNTPPTSSVPASTVSTSTSSSVSASFRFSGSPAPSTSTGSTSDGDILALKLSELGFAGLPEAAGGFIGRGARKKAVATMVVEVVDAVVGL
ncbi:Ras GTPase activating protein ira2 [Gaertneriomyces sp. JEL0708]|nr:Ras GTPase activating protein ira2 [Gaertneriomyces sp. JEL0708]